MPSVLDAQSGGPQSQLDVHGLAITVNDGPTIDVAGSFCDA